MDERNDFDEKVQKTIARSRESGGSCSLLHLWLSDVAPTTAAPQIQQLLRNQDCVEAGRGDCAPTLRILLVDVARSRSERVAERLLQFCLRESKKPPLVRIASFPEDGENIEKLLQALAKNILGPLQERTPCSEASSEAPLIVGESLPMKKVRYLIERFAKSGHPVLIEGETGTGKELVARSLHFNSPRAQRPFLPINCAALSETLLESELFGHVKGAFTGALAHRSGLLELANGGTLFLDEVEEMSEGMQKKMLRVLEEETVRPVGGMETRRFDTRIVAATNRHMQGLIREGQFRMDLYYRLNTLTITLPTLRERAEDIPPLVRHFLKESSRKMGIRVEPLPDAILQLYLRYPWPGNVRELRNELARLILLNGNGFLVEHLPLHIREFNPADQPSSEYHQRRDVFDRDLILEALKKSNHSFRRAAKLLQIDKNTLLRRARKYGIRITREAAARSDSSDTI